ncbi:MAG: fused MFS/spermidine synthase [Xanthobacteraceae bacterium]
MLPASPEAASRNAAVLALHTAAIFLSALLLFSVQPLFTKMVLPRLGGSPAVWSVAMAFFQTLLLAGYAYAHWLTTLASRRVAVALHLVLLAAAVVTLPLSIAAGWGTPPPSYTALWLFGLFVVSIGLPFFALAANNPLLQAWFARSGHPHGGDPYFLYAASNVGSFLALLSYPVLVEPMLTLRAQNFAWTVGYGLLVVLIAACGVVLLRAPGRIDADVDAPSASPPAWRLRLRWVFLAAVPSGLLVAVTAHISADVAAAPLLWVLPLSLYLLTWVLVFLSRPPVSHRVVLALTPLAIGGAVLLIGIGSVYNLPLTLGGHLTCFFVIALACHGELAHTRPPAAYLTGFYVALSFGGMVGGLFTGLLAPYAFSWVAEYPILIAAAVLCRPAGAPRRRLVVLWFVLAAAVVALAWPAWRGGEAFVWMEAHRSEAIAIAAIVAMLVMLLLPAHRFKGVAATALALTLIHLYPGDDGRVETVRSFFGVHKIVTTTDGRYRVLMHGTTIHGAERLPAAGEAAPARPELISYYHANGGIGQAIAAIRARKSAAIRVAVIGLGAGTLTCAAAPGEHWRFFEIDPLMVATARDPRRFTFISACAPDLAPVIGDARLTFADEPDGAYDLVIVDAYSSDAIPVHLATQEAMAIYQRKLAPHGAVLMHVSNRHLDLADVAVGIAAANGLASWVHTDETDDSDAYIFSTTVVLSAAAAADIGTLADTAAWVLTPPSGDRVWSDDYSNVLGALLRHWRGG